MTAIQSEFATDILTTILSRSRRKKLTPKQVRSIRADPRVLRVIGAEFGITKQSVRQIKLRNTYRHVGDTTVDYDLAARNQAKGGKREKLAPEQVGSIRLDTRALEIIAAEYRVTSQAIWNIKHKKSYKYVDGESFSNPNLRVVEGFSPGQVKAIRADRRSYVEIGKDYDITKTAVWAIKSKVVYGWVVESETNFYEPPLSDAQVRAIRKDSRLYREIAEDYLITIPTVGRIKQRKTYKGVPEEEQESDERKRGRTWRSGVGKLSRDQVQAIRADTRTHREIVDAYEELKAQSEVSLIKSYKLYGDVPDLPNSVTHSGRRRNLTPDQARAIFVDPRSMLDIGEEYGLSRASVGDIKRRVTYAEATADLGEPVILAQGGGHGKLRSDNTSGHNGIGWDKSRQKWKVRFGGRMIGRYGTLEEAITIRKSLK